MFVLFFLVVNDWILNDQSETFHQIRLLFPVLLGCPVGSAGKRLGSVGYNPNIPHL